jgi:hypothetical protein
MMNNKVVFICAQPDVPYFHWQVEVFIHNAMKNGINPNWIEIVFGYEHHPSQEGIDIASRYPYVRVFFYKQDKNENYGYIPIIRPNILSKHFAAYPELSQENIFYHDSDIIFRELPNFDLLTGDNIWYLSDTVSYIGSAYIKSKSDALFIDMCNIAGIDPDIVAENNENSGGAQYLMKGIDSEFWKEVEFVSLDLYKFMSDREANERAHMNAEDITEYNPIQKWCADMWAVLWCGLKRENTIRLSDELGFSWGSFYGRSEWEKHKIMHNAGVTDSGGGKFFYKGEFINSSPWDADFSGIDPHHNSYNYVQAILYAKERRNLQ